MRNIKIGRVAVKCIYWYSNPGATKSRNPFLSLLQQPSVWRCCSRETGTALHLYSHILRLYRSQLSQYSIGVDYSSIIWTLSRLLPLRLFSSLNLTTLGRELFEIVVLWRGPTDLQMVHSVPREGIIVRKVTRSRAHDFFRCWRHRDVANALEIVVVPPEDERIVDKRASTRYFHQSIDQTANWTH